MLIFDDTIQEKAWTDESELICWRFDHCGGPTVKGINLLNAVYHSKGGDDSGGLLTGEKADSVLRLGEQTRPAEERKDEERTDA